MKMIFLRAGVVAALVLATTTVSGTTGTAAPTGTAEPAAVAAYPTCNAGWWRWQGTDNQLRRFLPNRNPTGWNCQLQEGDYNNWGVVALQNMLAKCYNQSIAIDGDFGPGTKAALKNAQTWDNATDGDGENLVVDGIYGPASRDTLMWPYYRAQDEGNLDAPHFCSEN
jgi:hypothetical protein